MLAAIGLLVSPPLLAESHLFGGTRACGGIVRRYHGIITAKIPLLAILGLRPTGLWPPWTAVTR
jgi:hypothetical protein